MKTGFCVCDAMTKKPVIVPQSTSIADCARIMQRENIGSLVIGEKKRLDGIITEQDLVRKVLAKAIDAEKIPVSEIMVRQIFTVSPEIDLFDAIQMMDDYNIRHMPVIARKHVIGYLTLKDILRIQPQLCELIVDKFAIREESDKPVFNSRRDEDKDYCPLCGK
jgi:signal-transduction protein with cAMP-binding, CBS, and nucleotidyltransferase domain